MFLSPGTLCIIHQNLRGTPWTCHKSIRYKCTYITSLTTMCDKAYWCPEGKYSDLCEEHRELKLEDTCKYKYQCFFFGPRGRCIALSDTTLCERHTAETISSDTSSDISSGIHKCGVVDCKYYTRGNVKLLSVCHSPDHRCVSCNQQFPESIDGLRLCNKCTTDLIPMIQRDPRAYNIPYLKK